MSLSSTIIPSLLILYILLSCISPTLSVATTKSKTKGPIGCLFTAEDKKDPRDKFIVLTRSNHERPYISAFIHWYIHILQFDCIYIIQSDTEHILTFNEHYQLLDDSPLPLPLMPNNNTSSSKGTITNRVNKFANDKIAVIRDIRAYPDLLLNLHARKLRNEGYYTWIFIVDLDEFVMLFNPLQKTTSIADFVHNAETEYQQKLPQFSELYPLDVIQFRWMMMEHLFPQCSHEDIITSLLPHRIVLPTVPNLEEKKTKKMMKQSYNQSHNQSHSHNETNERILNYFVNGHVKSMTRLSRLDAIRHSHYPTLRARPSSPANPTSTSTSTSSNSSMFPSTRNQSEVFNPTTSPIVYLEHEIFTTIKPAYPLFKRSYDNQALLHIHTRSLTNLLMKGLTNKFGKKKMSTSQFMTLFEYLKEQYQVMHPKHRFQQVVHLSNSSLTNATTSSSSTSTSTSVANVVAANRRQLQVKEKGSKEKSVSKVKQKDKSRAIKKNNSWRRKQFMTSAYEDQFNLTTPSYNYSSNGQNGSLLTLTLTDFIYIIGKKASLAFDHSLRHPAEIQFLLHNLQHATGNAIIKTSASPSPQEIPPLCNPQEEKKALDYVFCQLCQQDIFHDICHLQVIQDTERKSIPFCYLMTDVFQELLAPQLSKAYLMHNNFTRVLDMKKMKKGLIEKIIDVQI